ncbi:MAG: helix-turn-helix transcriptional regulator [Candidatus Enterosoma sp.]|nr:helix-turn-helix transcriptional regulator [Candidatus Enterosoma sp.]
MNYDYKTMIITLRNKLILTQEEFAKLLGVSFASVNRWERGHHEPTTKAKRKIVELCRKNKVELITSKEEK